MDLFLGKIFSPKMFISENKLWAYLRKTSVLHGKLTMKRKAGLKLSHHNENYATITRLASVMMNEVWILEWCAIYMLFSTRIVINLHDKSKQQQTKFYVTTADGCVARLFVSSGKICGTSAKRYLLRSDLVTFTNSHH
jgi:hypothetical protein